MKTNEIGALKAKSKNCKDCGAPFVLTEGDLLLRYKNKGFHEPERCITCRRSHRKEKEAEKNAQNR